MKPMFITLTSKAEPPSMLYINAIYIQHISTNHLGTTVICMTGTDFFEVKESVDLVREKIANFNNPYYMKPV